MDKYYKCYKCGSSISDTEGALCAFEAPYRISGICGGSMTEELTPEEYLKLIKT